MFEINEIHETQTVEPVKQGLGAGIKFCPQCNNMLYPRAPEDKTSKELLYECKRCGHSESSSDTCIYVNILKYDNEAGNISKKYITADPYLKKSKHFCPFCMKVVDCVFYLDESIAGGDSMKEFCECTEIPDHIWPKDQTDEIRDQHL